MNSAPGGRSSLLALLAGTLLAACGSGSPTTPGTGLAGVVLRGPTQPVCTADDPCEAPFAAGFELKRNGFPVRRFASDEAGMFRVEVAPGDYTVVPDPDAPIISPGSQARDVTVAARGFTEVKLHFDTGIR